jgi:hypothetical protein
MSERHGSDAWSDAMAMQSIVEERPAAQRAHAAR